MCVMDMPSIPIQEPLVLAADATSAKTELQKFDRAIGVCHLSENPFVPKSAVNVLSPSLDIIDPAVMLLKNDEPPAYRCDEYNRHEIVVARCAA